MLNLQYNEIEFSLETDHTCLCMEVENTQIIQIIWNQEEYKKYF